MLFISKTFIHITSHLKALVFLHAFEESVDCHLLSSFCDDSNFTYLYSSMYFPRWV